ncbi:TonB-dependent receptor [Pseudomonas sp. MM211]|uniref:TonB-dependent siderophore receptor n=1 Tax=Pseudomonas sp. MM211 TaxID=2866808 RepID=UPI001CEDA696|nr:TonB-dependent receptor [Pseudomonas sp. MM211]UCJ17879.1 TonB-dependent receptor [Pseudomonas sp. MM211]
MLHPLIRNRLAVHLQAALLSSAAFAVPVAYAAEPAQASSSASVRQYNIGAGSLTEVLSRFASQAGVALSFDAAQTNGRQSKGLQGAYSVEAGFATLLADSGLQASNAGGSYILGKTVDNSDALELGATSINASGLGETTESSGSYTTGAMRTATKLALTTRETPQSVTVVTRQRMDDQNMITLEDALKSTPGVTVQKFSAVRPLIYSRGFQVENLMYDGLPTSYDGDFVPSPDLAMYDRVEIVRGATGLMQGAGTPSAAINMVRKRPTRDTKVSVSGSAGSWDNYRSELDASSALNDSGSVRGRMVASYNDKDSFRDVESSELGLLYGITEIDLGERTMLTLGGSFQNDNNNTTWGGIPVGPDGSDLGLSRSTYFGNDWEYWDKDTKGVFAEIEHHFDNDWNLRLAAVKNWTTSDILASFVRPTGNTWQQRTVQQNSTYDQTSYDGYLSGPFQALGREHELVLGGSYRESSKETSGGYAPNFGIADLGNWDSGARPKPENVTHTYGTLTETTQKSLYATTRLSLTDPLKLILGGRLDWYAYDQDIRNNPSVHYNTAREVTRYGGLVYELNPQHSVYISYTDIFQPQTSITIDQSLLEPITGKNYEMGVKGEYFGGALNASAALFQIDQENRGRLVSDTGCNGMPCYEASGKVRSQGIDLELNGTLMPNWEVAAGYTYTQAKYKQDSDPSNVGRLFDTDVPRHLFKLSTYYRLPGDLSRWKIGGSVYRQNRTYNVGTYTNTATGITQPSLVEQDAYTLVDLMASYQVNKHLLTQLSVNNVLDKTYYEGLASQPFGGRSVYGAPRNFTVSAKYSF